MNEKMTNHMILPKLLMKHELIISKSVLMISAWWSRKTELKKCFKYDYLRSSLVSTRLARITRRFISRWEAWRWIFRILKEELETYCIWYTVYCMTWYTDLEDIFARVARQLVWRYLSFTLDKLYWIVLTITKIIRLPSVIFSLRGLH